MTDATDEDLMMRVGNGDRVAFGELVRALCKAILRDHLGLPPVAIHRVVFPDSGDVHPVPELIV